MTKIHKALLSLSDERLKAFNSRLIPSIPHESILGVSTPKLRRLARCLTEAERQELTESLPHEYFEENQLHAFIISELPEHEAIPALKAFLPYVDNWATCDQLSPKCFAKKRELLFGLLDELLDSKHEYTLRFGVDMLLKYRIFEKPYLDRLSGLRRDEYYIKTAVAWFFATAMAYDFERVCGYLQRLEADVRAMTVRKGCESLRLTREQKNVLRAL